MKKCITILFIICHLFSSCDLLDTNIIKKTIKYEIIGNATDVDIWYFNSTGGSERHRNIALPWELTFSVEFDKYTLFLAFIEANGRNGNITVNVFVNGKIFKTSTSSGSSPSARAEGYLVREK